MRRATLSLLLVALGLPAAWGADPRPFEDAALHAVHFVDAEEGWAVGDDGVVWHTLDHGQSWERQPTGVRASLRAVHFVNLSTGWIAGREELPHNGGSSGVLLYTRDGGVKWQCVNARALPGLNDVYFVDTKTGFVVGDGSEQFPTGFFQTTDGGRTWQPIAGPRSPAWLSGHFAKNGAGLLAGAWGRLASFQEGAVVAADLDPLGGRSLQAVEPGSRHAVAVGQGGLVLVSADPGGTRWGYAKLPLPAEVLANVDFHALARRGDHVWVAGRPGSVLLCSPDQGQSWLIHATGQSLPLHGLYFVDERRGWAVGEFGCILATTDGGKTWAVQRRGGQRAAVLFVHGRASSLPVESVTYLGGHDGYLAAALQVLSSDPASAAPERAAEGMRWAAAVRQAGGAAGEALWHFPLAQHLARADKRDLISAWDRQHGDQAAELLIGQLVLTLRMWRPDCVVTDSPHSQDPAADGLVGEAVQQAFHLAADPQAFPRQLQQLHLTPWKVGKLYGLAGERPRPQVVLDATAISPPLAAVVRDFAAPAAGLLADTPVLLPAQRSFYLLESHVDGAMGHRELMQGLPVLGPGVNRRPPVAVAELPRETEQALRASRNLQAMAESPAQALVDPNQLVTQIQPLAAKLPEEAAGQALFRIANQYARSGQWLLAREVYLVLADRYPTHPRAAEACRWLIQHGTSSEARRRQERGQFILTTHTSSRAAQGDLPDPKKSGVTIQSGVDVVQERQLAMIGSLKEARQWYQQSLDLGARLATHGPLVAEDPSIQFCLQAARRQLGDAKTPQEWYGRFRSGHPDGPWGNAAAAELWLSNRLGQPPRPVAYCRQTATRPFLDGKLDDACWQGGKPLALANAVGDTAKDYPTEARLAYDQDFLYVAVRCRHPVGHAAAPVKDRKPDADLRAFDRVSLLLDLDRDYATYYHLQVDQRGCVCDDCWGDRTWNPRWFVAVHTEPEGWQVEAAIPLMELTGDPVTVGRTWACNVVRVLPGRGVQAWSLPADVEPRPEGMGFLMFLAEPRGDAKAP
jgi:photosystem II stability/assembly factor-like uncharacterized protein